MWLRLDCLRHCSCLGHWLIGACMPERLKICGLCFQLLIKIMIVAARTQSYTVRIECSYTESLLENSMFPIYICLGAMMNIPKMIALPNSFLPGTLRCKNRNSPDLFLNRFSVICFRSESCRLGYAARHQIETLHQIFKKIVTDISLFLYGMGVVLSV